MKSIEEKAKAYDKAKYIMKEYLESGNAGVIAENTIKKAFPELKESEDERIRKKLLEYFKSFTSETFFNGVPTSDAIAWLEKQGDKTAWSEDDENRINRLIAYFEDKESFTAEDDVVYANWLNSIKDRVQPHSQWKPSSKQMEALKEACDEHWEPDGLDPLYTLWEQLKKLRDE